MKLHVVNTGYFKLDGGAMFGVVPKSIWQKTNPADENNLCTWALRCLLIEDGDKLILIDTGTGDKQADKFFSYYYQSETVHITEAVRKAGFSENEVTDVILTHLHFDHVGGATKYNISKDKIELSFPHARYWSNQSHWNWATVNPNPREKASFLTENLIPIFESGQLNFIAEQTSPFENISFLLADGHTEKQMIPVIETPKGKLIYAADLLPSAGHIPLPYVMGYDVRPLLSMQEKEAMLKMTIEQNCTIFFEHDSVNECCTLQHTEKGIRVLDTFSLSMF